MSSPLSDAGRFQTRRRRSIWLVFATAAVGIAVIVAGLAYVSRPDSQNWYTVGKNLEATASQQHPVPLADPVTQLTKMCAADLTAAAPGQRPAAADSTDAQQWLQGCAAGYDQKHPGQLIQDSAMYAAAAQPCLGACESQWKSAGKTTGLSAMTLPGLGSAAAPSRSAAATWCADLTANKLSQPLSASVEAHLQANLPLDVQETGYWDQGCAAGYLAEKDSLPPDSAMTITGAFNAAPHVTIPAQPAVSSLYVKTLIQGTGPKLTSSEGLVGNYVTYDWSGKTSKLIGSSYQQRMPALFVGQLLPGLEEALVGQRAGSRVLAVIPPADAFGSTGNSQEGIGPNDTLVFVVDMDSTFATASVPGTQTSTGGGALPTVTPPAAGSTAGPAITIPANVTPPGTLQVKPLIKGTGPVVQKDDVIAVQDTGMVWQTGETFQSTWTGTGPFTTVIGAGQVIAGWDTGLVGQTVGSRVLLVVPPADGYGSAGSPSVGISGTDTLVFVVDILAAT
jgi:FKBP-type peptidyl-prolyl cis-trans isomerase